MPLDPAAPPWAHELALAYESGAHGQFVLYGNVSDRFPLAGRLVSLTRYLDAQLLTGFDLVFLYDPGNGLSVLRGAERLQDWPAMKELGPWPRDPRDAVDVVSRYLRYRANLRALGRGDDLHVACILRGADQILPSSRQGGFEVASLASLVRDWASEPPFADLAFASFLIADNLNDLHPQVANNPRVARVRVPLPDVTVLQAALAQLRVDHPAAFDPQSSDAAAAESLGGVSIAALQSLVRTRAHERKVLGAADWVRTKKALVESDAGDLIEFIESKKTLEQYHAQAALKAWLRQDIALWQASDLRALPMGYIFCGPVGTGKTYLVECLAGEAQVPVVKLKNFRDRWVGSSEGNLEKIFRLIRALGRCIVFIDEADQTLGKRDSGSGDSGLSGRLYSMIAQEMSDSDNRGRLMWILASSRPDLIEVDLKRPGRVDVKIPLLPTATVEESGALLRALLKRFDIVLDAAAMSGMPLPLLLTPGAAEALAVKVYRLSRTGPMAPVDALAQCLDGYQPPVPRDVLEFQMRIAIREATDLKFVPESLRHYADEAVAP
ncbi:MAG TPA: ATP-binding protein [Pseudomonadota bacterium]|nr:ATP-binding protein [Pseudomonadota bacterium]